MSNPSELGAILYSPETSFGEDVTTYTYRLPVIDAVDASKLKHDKIDSKRVNQYLQDGTAWVLGVMGGTISTKMYATGHGSSTSGAVTVDANETFLSYLFSGAGALGAGGTASQSAASGTTATGGTATIPLTTASGTFSAGSLCRIGSLTDARGQGQAFAVSTHSGNNLTLLTGMTAAPNNGDVIYSGTMLYLPETPANVNVTGIRFLVQTANLEYECHGCWPMSVKLTGTNPGQLPTWDIEWGVSWWRLSTVAFPSAVSSNQYNPSPVANGSLFVNVVGTATRPSPMHVYRDFSIDIKLGMVPMPGPGGFNQYQNIVGARRVPADIRVKWTEDADAATTTPVLESYFLGTNKYHALWTHNTSNGASLAAYFPALNVVGARPVQMAKNKINSLQIECEANAGATNTTDLTTSAARFLYS